MGINKVILTLDNMSSWKKWVDNEIEESQEKVLNIDEVEKHLMLRGLQQAIEIIEVLISNGNLRGKKHA
jgi:hypothetical protein